MGGYRRKTFLSMDVAERNLVIDLFTSIKKELKQNFTLEELGFKGSWDNVDLKALLNLTDDQVQKILSQKRIKSRSNFLRDLRRLVSIMRLEKSLPEMEQTLDAWLES